MRRILNSGRIIFLLGGVLAAGISPALAEIRACSDVTYDLDVWYTDGASAPEGDADQCSWRKHYTYREGQCGIFCGTDNCGWGDWPGKLRRRALNEAIFELGHACSGNPGNPQYDAACAEKQFDCGTALTLWGAEIRAEDDAEFGRTRIKWSVAGDPALGTTPPIFNRPAVSEALGRVYWGYDAVFADLLAVSREAEQVWDHPGNRADARAGQPSTFFDLRPDSVPGNIQGPVVAPDGTVYVASEKLWAYRPVGNSDDPRTQRWWDLPLPQGAATGLAVASDGIVYLTTDQGSVYAVRDESTSAQILWQRDLGGSLTGVSLGGDGTIYVGSWEGRLFALDASLEPLWTYAPAWAGGSSITRVGIAPPSIAADGTLFLQVVEISFFGVAFGSLVSLEPRNVNVGAPANLGYAERWVMALGFGTLTGAPAVATVDWNRSGGLKRWLAFGIGNRAYVGRDLENGDIVPGTPVTERLSLSSFDSVEFAGSPGTVSGTPAIARDGTVFVTTRAGQLYSQNIGRWGTTQETASTTWHGGERLTPPVLVDRGTGAFTSDVIFGSETGPGGNVLRAYYAGAGPDAFQFDWPMAGRDPGNRRQAHAGLSATPLTWDFGTVGRNEQSEPRTFTISSHFGSYSQRWEDPRFLRLEDGLWVVDTGAPSFVIDRGDCSGDDPFLFGLGSGDSCSGSVIFSPGVNPGTKMVELAFNRDNLIMRMHGKSDAAIISVPESLDFSASPVQEITVANDGTVPLVIDATLSDGSFRFDPDVPSLHREIPPFSSTTTLLKFRIDLAEDGLGTGTLHIVSNDESDPVKRVLLYGRTGTATGTSLFGQVTDARTGKPLGNAEVRVAGTSRRTLSSSEDEDLGFYRIRIDDVAMLPVNLEVECLAGGCITSSGTARGYDFRRVMGVSSASLPVPLPLQPSCENRPRIEEIVLEGTTCSPEPIGCHSFSFPETDLTFVSGISTPETDAVRVRAKVDWCGTLPENQTGTVNFSGIGFTADETVDAQGWAETVVNMGEREPCFKLSAVTIAGGTSSEPVEADFSVMPRFLPEIDLPLADIPFGYGRSEIETDTFFKLESTAVGNLPFLDFVADNTASDPIKGLISVFKWVPEVTETYYSDGSYKVRLAFEGAMIDPVGSDESGEEDGAPRFNIPSVFKCLDDPDECSSTSGGKFFVPTLNFKGEFNDDPRFCRNSFGGTVGFVGGYGIETIQYSAIFIGPIPVPVYGKLGASVEIDAEVGVTGLPIGLGSSTGTPGSPAFDGAATITAELTGALGAGISEVLAVEGWVSGGIRLRLLPSTACTLFAKGGYTIYAVLYTDTQPIAGWEVPCSDLVGRDAGLLLAAVPPDPMEPGLMRRDYVRAEDYATLRGGSASATLSRGTGPSGEPRVIWENIFPQSENSVSAAGESTYLVWLHDDLARDADNRTVAVLDSWDGTEWTPVCGDRTAPCRVSDDGTADFHPQLLVLEDGTAHVAWESLRSDPKGDVGMAGMMSELEICTSRFDPGASPPFSAQHCLTDNAHVDRSPRLAGASADDLLLVWVSNDPPSDGSLDPLEAAMLMMEGGPEAPNVLWSSHYDGTFWSDPQRIAEIPHPMTRLSLAYDGSDGYLVMSVDPDGESLVCAVNNKIRCEEDEDCGQFGACEFARTVLDRELVFLRYDGSNDRWAAAPERLTDDDLPDDGPKVARDAEGNFLLVWLRDTELVSVADLPAFAADLDPASIRPIWDDEGSGYSYNLSDATLAQNGEQLALVWAQPAEGGYSDLVASPYDPRFQLWGVPRSINETDTALYERTGKYDLETNVTATFDVDAGNDVRLLAVYDRTMATESAVEEGGKGSDCDELLINCLDTLPDLEREETTDLAMVVYELRDDPALADGSFFATPGVPRAGEAVTFSVRLENLGDRALMRLDPAPADPPPGQAAVRFRAGTEVIDTVQVLDGDALLAPGDTTRVEVDWVIPADTPPGLTITAEIVPDFATDDRDPTNNTATLSGLLSPDLSIEGASRKRLEGDRYEVKASVVNVGSAPVEESFRLTAGDSDGPLAGADWTIGPLAPGEGAVRKIEYEYDVTQGTATEEILFTADADGAIAESDEDNNERSVLLQSTDTTRPTIMAPQSVTLEATGPGGAPLPEAALLNVTATDNSGAVLETISCTSAAGNVLPLGTSEVVCTATDPAGNVASSAMLVHVVDTTPPALAAPGDVSAECTAPTGAVVGLGAPFTSDLVCLDDVAVGDDAPAEFPFGETTVTWTATDCNGQSAVPDTQLVTVVDTLSPELVLPAGIPDAECASPDGTPVAIGSATGSDVCCADEVTFTSDDPGTFPFGATTVSWMAEDCHGVTATGAQAVTVVDTLLPELVLPADIPDAECSSTGGTPVAIGNVTASDICCGDGVTIASDDPGTFPFGASSVSWTADDCHGLTATGTQAVTVVDTLSPAIVVPADILDAECTSPDGTPVTIGSATSSDVCCGGDVSVASNEPGLFPLGPTTVTWTATDCHALQQSDTQTVNIVDTTAPEITASVSPDVLWPPNHKLVEIRAVVPFSDICDAGVRLELVSITSSESNNKARASDDIQEADFGTPDMTFKLRAERSGHQDREYTIVYRAIDASGNATDVTAIVRVPHDQSGVPLDPKPMPNDATPLMPKRTKRDRKLTRK